MAKKESLKERLKQKQKDLKRNGGERLIIYPPDGTSRYRVLPPPAEEDFSMEVIQFYIQNAEQGSPKSFISLRTFGEKCAMMEAYERLCNSGKSVDAEYAKTLKPKRKQLIPVIKYKDPNGKVVDTETGVKLLAITNGVCSDLIDYYTDDTDGGDFTHPVSGSDIKITRTGEKLNTDYSSRVCKPTKLPKEYRGTYNPKEMLEKIKPTYEESLEMAKKVFGSISTKKKKGKEVTKKKKKTK